VAKGVILIVDDEPVILSTLSEMFGQEYTLFLASNAAEALDILSREKVHVVVSDFKMPGMDGLALLIEVKRRHPLCARVLMTAYADMQLVIRAMNEGEIHRFLSKPYKSFEFRRILEEALELSRIMERREEKPHSRLVLIAHDSQIGQATLKLLLTPAYQVACTANGIEALSMISARQVDAVILGVGLELLDGCTIASYLKKEKRSPIPVVIWASGLSGPYEEYLRECGADLVLDDRNQSSPEQLQQFLRKRLA
jgi:CheY-like chemotaxis protein